MLRAIHTQARQALASPALPGVQGMLAVAGSGGRTTTGDHRRRPAAGHMPRRRRKCALACYFPSPLSPRSHHRLCPLPRLPFTGFRGSSQSPTVRKMPIFQVVPVSRGGRGLGSRRGVSPALGRAPWLCRAGARLGTLASPCWRQRLWVAVLSGHNHGPRVPRGRQDEERETETQEGRRTFCWEEGVRRVL